MTDKNNSLLQLCLGHVCFPWNISVLCARTEARLSWDRSVTLLSRRDTFFTFFKCLYSLHRIKLKTCKPGRKPVWLSVRHIVGTLSHMIILILMTLSFTLKELVFYICFWLLEKLLDYYLLKKKKQWTPCYSCIDSSKMLFSAFRSLT